MSSLRYALAAASFAGFGLTVDLAPAEASPPSGHNNGGCRSNCGPTTPPPPVVTPAAPTEIHGGQGGGGGDAAAEANSKSAANASSGGNVFSPRTTYEGSAPSTSALVTTRCGWGVGASLIGGSLSIGGNGDTCNQRDQAISGLGNSTDVFERGMFAEQYIQVTPSLGDYRGNAAANAETCGPNRAPVSSIFAGQANMSESLCAPNGTPPRTGIENSVNVQVSGSATTQRTESLQPVNDAPTTCEAATARKDSALIALDRAHQAWEAAGSTPNTEQHKAYGDALMDVNVNAAYQITLCPPGPRGS